VLAGQLVPQAQQARLQPLLALLVRQGRKATLVRQVLQARKAQQVQRVLVVLQVLQDPLAQLALVAQPDLQERQVRLGELALLVPLARLALSRQRLARLAHMPIWHLQAMPLSLREQPTQGLGFGILGFKAIRIQLANLVALQLLAYQVALLPVVVVRHLELGKLWVLCLLALQVLQLLSSFGRCNHGKCHQHH
jgi:hypothetical protein